MGPRGVDPFGLFLLLPTIGDFFVHFCLWLRTFFSFASKSQTDVFLNEGEGEGGGEGGGQELPLETSEKHAVQQCRL